MDEEISIGDFVLTGGELPAMVVADAVARLVPGVLSDPECFENESHWNGLLEGNTRVLAEDMTGITAGMDTNQEIVGELQKQMDVFANL